MEKERRFDFKELFRFLVCGAAAALTDYLFAQLTIFIFNLIKPGFSDEFWITTTIISTVIGFIFGVIVNYLLSTYWVYRNVRKDINTKSAKFKMWFTLLSLAAAILSILTMLGCSLFVQQVFGFNITRLSLVNLIKEDGISFLTNAIFWAYFISFCIKTIVGLIFNYFTRKYILYKQD